MWRKIILVVLLGAFVAVLPLQPAQAQTNITWTAQYFNNIYLQDPAVLTRLETTSGGLNYNWGAGSPNSAVNTDNFTARWVADPYLTAGTYRFYALVDDNVRVMVDSQVVIDTFSQPRVGQTVTGDITLGMGSHHIQIDYREDGGDAYIQVSWTNLTDPSTTGQTGPWIAQYYGNAALAGTPTLIQSESSPSHNWGYGSPAATIGADNFSARWSASLNVNAGTYQINVRADDGIRVYVDGVLHINEWHLANVQTYTAKLTLTSGQHTFVVEYFESGGVAFLEYNFVPVTGSSGTGTTGAAATVTGAYRLNVRSAPTALNSEVLTKISRNETYPIVGRNADSSWWQINVNGTIGWVSGRYVTTANAGNVPVTTSATPVQGAAATVTGAYRLNVRSAPTALNSEVLTKISRNETYPVVGRNADSSWWQINVNGTIGWVSGRYVTVSSGTVATPVPIGVCAGAPASRLKVGQVGRVTPGLPNNMRSAPTNTATLLASIPPGGLFTVISGPSCSGSMAWWQVNYNGIIGWTAEGSLSEYWLEPAS